MSGDADRGLSAGQPFRFHCHRCANCCTAGAGYVWLKDGEPVRLARRLGMEEAAFLERHVRRAPDPRTGELRLSLREERNTGGRCALLEGKNTCSVYEDRPEHCSTFPYWDSVLTTEAGFESARAVCPGIAVIPTEEQRTRAFALLRELYAEFEAFLAKAGPVCIGRGVCCRFEEAGHELYATALEADYAVAAHPDVPQPEAPGRCPYHVAGRCTAREGRPLGCRTYFCDTRTTSVLEEAHEHFLTRVREIERETGYPAAYGRFPDLLEARRTGD